MLFLVLTMALGWALGCATGGAERTGTMGRAEAPAAASVKKIPSFELPVPQMASDRDYLGLSGTGNFKLSEVKAPVLIIEVFSFYCPFCQQAAPRVNELYQAIDGRPDLKDKVKLIGIGASNTPLEVDSFREKYQVPFPLFADQSMEIFHLLGARGTPTFVGVKRDGQGGEEQFYFGEGAFQDTGQFLSEIIRLSGLKG